MQVDAAHGLFHQEPGKVTREKVLLPKPGDDEVVIKTSHSAISPGTEAMIFQGRFPLDASQDTTIKSMQGNFAYPFSYGYSLIGEIIGIGPKVAKKWLHKRVFSFHPHQDIAVVSILDCHPIPDHISSPAAGLLPNLESAINFVLDAAPLAGERVLVLGQGIVGLLTTAVLARFPLTQLVTVDPIPLRRQISTRLGANATIDPIELNEGDFDLSFELSGNPRALNTAIEMTGFAGRILIGSWYGENQPGINLGESFHRKRIQLLSSQVSSINPALSGRWTKKRRIELAWKMLGKIDAEQLITHEYSLDQCQQAFETVSQHKNEALQVMFTY